MKNFYKGLSILVCIGCLSFLAIPYGLATNEMEQITDDRDQIIKLNLLSRIKQKVSTDAGSVFVDLTPEAVKIGLPEAKLYGSVKQEELVDKTTRMYIKWHSIGVPTGSGDFLIDILPSPLLSQVRTPDENIEAGEIITATGDLQGLINKFLEIKERTKAEEPKHILEEKEEDEKEKGGLSPDGGGGGGTSAGGDYDNDGLDTAAEFSTNMITSNWEKCDPRIAQSEGKVYRQSKQVEVDENGEIVSSGTCVDYGGTVDIQKEYGEPCAVIYDFTNKKAYEQYQEFAVVDGETIPVTTCSNDFKRFYEIYSRPDACGVRHDFVTGKSIVQEELFYMNNAGVETKITDCVDSNKAYAHYLTESTCSPTIDRANGKVILYNRTAYTIDDGSIEFASECRPVAGGEKELFEAYCEQKYEHDFVAGQSYLRTKDYYLNDNNEPVYLTDCTRSTTVSFPHIFNASGCDTINDDESLRSTQYTSTSIDTPDGRVEISPCQENGIAIPYVYIGIENRTKVFTASGSWTVPTGVTSVTVFAVGGGNRGTWGGRWPNPTDTAGGVTNGGKTNNQPFQPGNGGGASEQVTQTVSVTPGANISVTIGQSDQNTKFGNLVTARYNYGSSYGGAAGESAVHNTDNYGGNGGKGGNGYGTAKLSGDGAIRVGQPAFYSTMIGIGGLGYGAGGGGGLNDEWCQGHNTAGGLGAPGYMKLTYAVNKYKRGDDTIYIQE
jgi:hypothetical protein